MKTKLQHLAALTVSVALILQATSLSAEDAGEGFKSIFNGKDLSGWDGNPKFWSVKEGSIIGQTTAENPTKGNTFLIYQNGYVRDFELRLSYKIVGGNSGIQYRSQDLGNWVVSGYQADFEAGKKYSGILYEERGRGILAERSQKTVIKPAAPDSTKHKVEVVGDTGKTSDELQAAIRNEDWNDYVIVAKGNHLTHIINGNLTADVVDEHAALAAKSGILALQLHAGPPMTVQFKNIRIKNLGGNDSAANDRDKLQGVWAGVEGTMNGQPIPKELVEAVQLTIKGDKYSSMWSEGSDQGTLKLNPGAQPKQLDIASEAAGPISAIYEFKGEELRICYGFEGVPRPTEFASTADSKILVVTYRRK